MKKWIIVVLTVILVISAAACGQNTSGGEEMDQMTENPGTESIDAAVYDELIGEFYEVIASGETIDSEVEGTFSLHAGLGQLNVSDMLAAAGYAAEDINGDGIPELIIGMITKMNGEQAEGNILYSMFTCEDGKPVLVFESFARDSYSWLGDGAFHYYGSGGAANSGFGTFILPAGSSELVCEEFRFMDIKPGTESEIGYYFNTAGSWNAEDSEELSTTNEEFWDMEAEALEQVKDIAFTPFTDYEKANVIDTVPFWAETSDDNYLAAAAYLGYAEGDLEEFMQYAQDSGMLERYPFLKQIDDTHTVLQDGGQWYAVIPDTGLSMTVYDAVPVESHGTVMPGEEQLLPPTEEPVLIRCNVSEIYPNVMIGIHKEGMTPISYSPSLSMKDGSLAKADHVFDFTPYELMPYYLAEVITDTASPEYQYYAQFHMGEIISTPVVGNETPEPILIKALKNDLIVCIEMTDDGMILAERTLMEGEVLFISAELMDDSPLQVSVRCEESQREGNWYAVTDNGEKNYRELICG